ncbi:cation:proton antiporter regulatory subunit [Aurantivibrio plasticivorans]
MSEIYVPEGSKFVGMTLEETKLYDQDINTLTLYRGSKSIPNPKKTRVLEANDKILCFGKLESMRSMIPAKTRRRRAPEILELPHEVNDD